MHGTLSEIDIKSILQLVEFGQRTGQLYIEPASTRESRILSGGLPLSDRSSGSWFVFFIGGQIAYAAGRDPNGLERLRDYLHRYRAEDSLKEISASCQPTPQATMEYAALWQLIERHALSPAQGRSILYHLVGEALFDLLSLHEGTFVFESAPPITPQLGSLKVTPLVAKTVKQIQHWKQFHPHLRDPEQCPVVTDEENLRASMTEKAYRSLTRACNGKTTLRQWSRYLNRDLLLIARAIYPYLQRGWVQLRDKTSIQSRPVASKDSTPPRSQIFCIDDDITICRSVERILGERGYVVKTAINPIAALPQLFECSPAIVFCDIAMPGIDGYEVCAMLRATQVFRQTPIIMLTGIEGFTDRVRARMVGATDYLTKPFGERELFVLLEKYSGLPYPPQASPS